MAVLDPGEIATQQSGAFFDVSLRHALLQPVVSDGLADVYLREHFRMRHSNQIGNFWQVEISAMTKLVQSGIGRRQGWALFIQRARNHTGQSGWYGDAAAAVLC